MTRYERVIEILDNSIGGPGVGISVHGAFWRGKTRDAFVAQPLVLGQPVLIVSDGAGSNLVKALKGEAPFDDSRFPRMPVGFDPVPDDDIAFIEQWIDDGCPEDEFQPFESNVDRFANFAWRQTTAPVVSRRYDDIWFLDANVGWAVNSNGQILHTTDGFRTEPIVQLHDPTIYWRCIAFANTARGWAGTLTEGRPLFDTIDGGRTWRQVANLPSDAPGGVCGIWVASESVIYATGTNVPEMPVRMMKSNDGGQTWRAWDMRPWADNLIELYFTSEDRGWVIGGKSDDPVPAKPNLKPVILYTEDGGETWVDQLRNIRDQFPLGEWGWKIHFVDPDHGFISLQHYDLGAILITTDGGRSWERRVVNDPQMNANLEGIGFVNRQLGWVSGWGDRMRQRRTSSASRDGGRTWVDANQIGRNINRFRFIGEPVKVGYSAGESVYRFSDEPADNAGIQRMADEQRARGLFEEAGDSEHVDRFEVPIRVPAAAGRLTVRIWDHAGIFVRTLLDVQKPGSGRRVLNWNGVDCCGRPCPDGQFIWRVTVDDRSESHITCFRRTVPILQTP